MPTDVLLDPAVFDRLAYASGVLENFPCTPLGTVRTAHLAFLRADCEGMQVALDSLSGVTQAPAEGIRLMLRVVLGEEAEVARMTLVPQGREPLEWECTCHAASAIGVACAMTGDLDKAQTHLMVARTLAQGLGLVNRAQMLTMEWGRIASLRGQPEPEIIAQQLQTPMPSRRRSWGQRTLAEAHMGLGSYTQALWSLGTPENDTPADAALRDFLHAVMRFPVAGNVPPDLDYARLAACVRQAQGGDERIDLAGIQGQPQAGYAAVIEGMAFAYTPTLAQQAARLLSRQTFAPADLSAYRVVALLSAVGNGALLHGPTLAGRELPLTTQLVQAVARLRSPEEVLGHLLHVTPGAFTLLAFSPVAAQLPGLGLASVPLLTGKHVMYGGQDHILPGRWGTAAVLRALGVPHADISRAEKARFKRALAPFPGPPVNLGWVARACLRLAASSQRLGHMNEAALWHESYAAVIGALSSDVQSQVRRYPPALS